MNKNDVQKARDAIIMAMLPNVTFDGWSVEALAAATVEAGYEPDIARAVFPDGIADVLDGLSELADRWMQEALVDVNPAALRVRDRIRTALLARFDALAPYKDAVRQSASFWAVPTRKPRGVKMVWRTADRIWDWAGDEARDYNRYTKRGLLSGIIVPTTLVWFDDASEEMTVTKEFLDRRIENVMQLGKFMGRFKNFKMSRAS